MATAVGAIGLGATLAGGVTSAIGAKQSAAAQQQMFNYQAGIADLNAKISKQNADWAIDTGEAQAQRAGIKGAQLVGGIRANRGASNLDVNSGSASDVIASQEKVNKMDMDTIRTNAAKTAYNYNVTALQDENQSTLYKIAGVNAEKAGDINVMSSILGTASSVSSKWLQGQQLGMWG